MIFLILFSSIMYLPRPAPVCPAFLFLRIGQWSKMSNLKSKPPASAGIEKFGWWIWGVLGMLVQRSGVRSFLDILLWLRFLPRFSVGKASCSAWSARTGASLLNLAGMSPPIPLSRALSCTLQRWTKKAFVKNERLRGAICLYLPAVCAVFQNTENTSVRGEERKKHCKPNGLAFRPEGASKSANTDAC